MTIGKKIRNVKKLMAFSILLGHRVSERVDDEDSSPLQFSSPGLWVSQGNESVEINQGAFPSEPCDEEVFKTPIGVFSFFASNRHDIYFPEVFERFPGELRQKFVVKWE